MMSTSRASVLFHTKRPRNVTAMQAAAILYGDWGTSKAYVLGLAFAVASYSSFWLIALVSVLNILVGLNYITICKCYPNGGGVYASVRNRSEVLALAGGFFLIADYIVTIALSALAAFEYLGVSHPLIWALGSIVVIGSVNLLGPRSTGNMAFWFTFPTLVVVGILGVLCLFHFDAAVEAVQPLKGGIEKNWTDFVGVILALSGIEAIANTTGVMRLDPGSTNAKPSVVRTATPAIIWVMIEVSVFTTLLGLGMHALPGLVTDGIDVSAPDYPNVRDSMLRYMGEVFSAELFGAKIGYVFGFIVSIVFAALLLSAVNTAIVALTSLLYVMAGDGELPRSFQKVNFFGVPRIPLLVAAVAPILVLGFVGNIAGLAHLYAAGFVGAIATNLGSTSTDPARNLTKWERYFMFATFLIMAAIEVTIFIDKPSARTFVIWILAIGLLLRGLVREQAAGKKHAPVSVENMPEIGPQELVPKEPVKIPVRKKLSKRFSMVPDESEDARLHVGSILCATTSPGKLLEFTCQESEQQNQHLYLLFIRDQAIYAEEDLARQWIEDQQARSLADHLQGRLGEGRYTFLYAVSNNPAQNIVDAANNLDVARVILSIPRHNLLHRIIRGDLVRQVVDQLPSEVDVIVIM